MPRLRLPAALALLTVNPAAASSPWPGGPVPSPNTWAVFSRSGEFLFVMRGATPDETPHPHVKDAVRVWSRELWAKYPRSGLYDQGTGELLWATDERLELRSGLQAHHVIVTTTGSVVWLSHAPYGPRLYEPRQSSWWGSLGNRKSAMSSAPGGGYSASKDGLCVRIIADGKTVASATAESLIADPDVFANEFAFGYKPWMAEAEVEGETLVLTTLDDQRITYDLVTGEVMDRRSLHGHDLAGWGLIAGGVLLVSAAGFALARKRPTPTPAVPTPVEPLLVLDDLIVTPPPPGLGRRRSGWHMPVRQ